MFVCGFGWLYVFCFWVFVGWRVRIGYVWEYVEVYIVVGDGLEVERLIEFYVEVGWMFDCVVFGEFVGVVWVGCCIEDKGIEWVVCVYVGVVEVGVV